MSEALRLADELESDREHLETSRSSIAAELRRQHAEIEALRAQIGQGVPEIDYEALIAAAYKRDRKWAQGTNGCVAFKCGAEWFRALLIASTPPAPQALTTCNCRWDGDTQVQQCTLHQAHIDAIHEWAERAKTAEAKLAAQQQEPMTAVRADFNNAINFAIEQGIEAAIFLRDWREGDTSGWPEFHQPLEAIDATMKKGQS